MAFIKQSFLSNLLNGFFGNETYDWLKSYAKIIVAIGTEVNPKVWTKNFGVHFIRLSFLLLLPKQLQSNGHALCKYSLPLWVLPL